MWDESIMGLKLWDLNMFTHLNFIIGDGWFILTDMRYQDSDHRSLWYPFWSVKQFIYLPNELTLKMYYPQACHFYLIVRI